MNVVIDHREPELFRSLFAKTDEVSTAQLACGDFLVDGQWLFERKTIPDLCVSVVDGRLFRQARALVKAKPHPVIILEGSLRDVSKSNMGRESVQGALVTLGVFFGLPILRSLTPEETVRLMRYTVEQGYRCAKGGVQRYGYRPRGRRARQLYVLQGLPGIGKKRAAVLMDHFGSVEAVVCADEDELAEVDGIGIPIAQAIRSLVGASFGNNVVNQH